jgi:hypothetical protein
LSRHIRYRTALLWVITQPVVVNSYWRFGTTHRSHLKGQEITHFIYVSIQLWTHACLDWIIQILWQSNSIPTSHANSPELNFWLGFRMFWGHSCFPQAVWQRSGQYLRTSSQYTAVLFQIFSSSYSLLILTMNKVVDKTTASLREKINKLRLAQKSFDTPYLTTEKHYQVIKIVFLSPTAFCYKIFVFIKRYMFRNLRVFIRRDYVHRMTVIHL